MRKQGRGEGHDERKDNKEGCKSVKQQNKNTMRRKRLRKRTTGKKIKRRKDKTSLTFGEEKNTFFWDC